MARPLTSARGRRDDFIRETRRQCKRGVDLIKIADSTWGDVQTLADDEIAAVVDEAHRHNVKVTIHWRGSTSTRAAARAGIDLIYHADLATEADLDIIAKAGMPIAPVLTSPWTGSSTAVPAGVWVIGCGIACGHNWTPPSGWLAMRAIAAYR
jgi:imidazolonepropionase-like amidohydrolase